MVGGLTKRLINFSRTIIGHVTGSLSLINVIASMVFAGLSMLAYCYVVGIKRKYPKTDKRATFGEMIRALFEGLLVLVMPGIVVGGVVFGVVTVTETGILAAIYALALSIFYKEFSFAKFGELLRETSQSVSNLLMIIATAGFFGWVMGWLVKPKNHLTSGRAGSLPESNYNGGKFMEGAKRVTRNTLVRRSKLFVPVNREKFVAKAWTREADCIILDLEDAVAPADKASARKLVKEVIPIVNKGGANIQVRINRDFEEEDLDAIIIPGLTAVMIPKSESAEEIQRIDRMVTQLEKERELPEGEIQFDLIIETAKGIVNADSIASSCPRIVQINSGQADLSVDMGFPRFMHLNFQQYYYAENQLLYAARAADVQCCGLGAQDNVDFTNISMGQDRMLDACRHSSWMGYLGSVLIHPGWVRAANEGYKPPQSDLELARRVKTALDEAYAKGEGSVSVDGHMYDVANMKYVNYILERADAIAVREAEKAAAIEAIGGIPS